MYQDAGYGNNWEPEGNNARRFDPYTRSCTIIASLFAVGFVLIVIVVLSLIPIYISQKNAKALTNIQTTKVSILNYNLQLQSSVDTFYPQAVLSDTNNRMALQAALTSMLQQDSTTMGSVVDINSATSRSLSTSYNLIFDLTVTGNKSCSAVTCLHQYHFRVINSLSNSNKTTSFVRYQQSNPTQIDWLTYRLPNTISSNASYASVDPKTIASELNTLIAFDQTQNEPTTANVTTTTEDVTTTTTTEDITTTTTVG